MPCDSRIIVNIEDMDRLEDAFKQLGYTIEQKTASFVKASRGNTTLAISSRSAVGDAEAITKVCRKYAEIGVRKFAKSKGYTVSREGDRKLILTKRG